MIKRIIFICIAISFLAFVGVYSVMYMTGSVGPIVRIYNPQNWQTVSIERLGTVKIPSEWKCEAKNDKITILDENDNLIISSEKNIHGECSETQTFSNSVTCGKVLISDKEIETEYYFIEIPYLEEDMLDLIVWDTEISLKLVEKIAYSFEMNSVNENDIEYVVNTAVRIQYGWGMKQKYNDICTADFFETVDIKELDMGRKFYSIDKEYLNSIKETNENEVLVIVHVYSPDLTIHQYTLKKGEDGKYLICKIEHDM